MKTCAVGRFRSSSKRRQTTRNYAKLRRGTRLPESAIQQGHFVVKSDPFFLSESLGAHSGDRSCFIFAYLTGKLHCYNTFERSFFQSGIPYMVFERSFDLFFFILLWGPRIGISSRISIPSELKSEILEILMLRLLWGLLGSQEFWISSRISIPSELKSEILEEMLMLRWLWGPLGSQGF